MKKIVPFEHDIKFNTDIYEITSISLEHNLKLKEDNIVKGDFILSGEYKITDSSINTEPFIYTVPFEIELDNKYNVDKLNIDIDDFCYEIINDQKLKIDIKVKLDGVELITDEEIKPDILLDEVREVDDLFKEENVEVPVIKEKPVFDMPKNLEDEFVTYHVHILRENDTLDEITTKYNVTKENLEEYNDIDSLEVGKKIIIPYINE